MRIDSGVRDLAEDWQLRVVGRRAMLLGRGLGRNFVADCREQTAASSVASELLLVLLVNCFCTVGEPLQG